MSTGAGAGASTGTGMEAEAEVDRLLRKAIAGHWLIKFALEGGAPRIAEPHDYGTMHGVDRVLVYQVGGESRSGRLPNWRLVTISKLSQLEVLDVKFGGPRGASSSHRHHWDRLFASVSQRPREAL